MIEKLRELVETALDWFPEWKLVGLYPKASDYYILIDVQAGLVTIVWPESFVREHDDVALVAEVRGTLMKERR